MIVAWSVTPWRYKKRWSNQVFDLALATDTVHPPLSVRGAY